MQRRLLVFSVLALLVLPLQGLAQTHSGHNAAPPAKATTSGHGAMMQGGAIMLEEVTDAGVKAMVHLMDTGAMMAKMGKKENYHFMIMFTDLATGKAVSQGSVALKITVPGGIRPGKRRPSWPWMDSSAPISACRRKGHISLRSALNWQMVPNGSSSFNIRYNRQGRDC